jgi:polyketide biosynthesis acyl carrier protein
MEMTKSEIFEVVKKNALEILDVGSDMVTIDKSLSDLGANSVDRVEIVTLTMEDLGIKIPFMSFAAATNIEDLVDILSSNLR